MGLLTSYDPAKIIVIYSGAIIDGFAPGSFVEVFRSAPEFRDLLGCDGETTRANTKDARGTIKISLLQTSKSNLVFSVIASGDSLTGLGSLPFLILDKEQKKVTEINVYATAEAWVNNRPKITFSKGIEIWTWELRCNNLIPFTGGGG